MVHRLLVYIAIVKNYPNKKNEICPLSIAKRGFEKRDDGYGVRSILDLDGIYTLPLVRAATSVLIPIAWHMDDGINHRLLSSRDVTAGHWRDTSKCDGDAVTPNRLGGVVLCPVRLYAGCKNQALSTIDSSRTPH